MQVKNSTLALIIASLFLSGSALASGGHDRNSNGGIDDSFNTEDSFNTDLDYNKTNTTNTTNTTTNTSSTNEGNDNSSWDSEMNMNSWMFVKKESTDISIDVDTVIAESALSAEVTGNTVSYGASSSPASSRGFGRGHGHDNDDSCCGGLTVTHTNSLSGFDGAAGINVVGQNAGNNSLVQQAISTNASVFTN